MLMARILAISVMLIALAAGCGSPSIFADDIPTNAPPIVSRVDPTSGSPGDTITIFGFGFSLVPPNNIVVIGGTATPATDYTLLDQPTATEIEALTVVVPDGAQAGESGVVVVVHDFSSNADVLFTVTP